MKKKNVLILTAIVALVLLVAGIFGISAIVNNGKSGGPDVSDPVITDPIDDPTPEPKDPVFLGIFGQEAHSYRVDYAANGAKSAFMISTYKGTRADKDQPYNAFDYDVPTDLISVGEKDLIIPVKVSNTKSQPSPSEKTLWQLEYTLGNGQELYYVQYYDESGDTNKWTLASGSPMERSTGDDAGKNALGYYNLLLVWRDFYGSNSAAEAPKIQFSCVTLAKGELFQVKAGSINITVDKDTLEFIYSGANYDGHGAMYEK